MPSDLPSIRITLTPEQRIRLRQISTELDTPQSTIVRTALRDYFARRGIAWADDPDAPGQHLKSAGGSAIRGDSG